MVELGEARLAVVIEHEDRFDHVDDDVVVRPIASDVRVEYVSTPGELVYYCLTGISSCCLVCSLLLIVPHSSGTSAADCLDLPLMLSLTSVHMDLTRQSNPVIRRLLHSYEF